MRRDAESGRAEGHVSQLDEIGNCNETQIQVRKVTTHGERREGWWRKGERKGEGRRERGGWEQRERQDKIRTIHRHLINLCGVVLLDVPQDSDVIRLDKVDGYTLPAEPSGSSNPWKQIIRLQSEAASTMTLGMNCGRHHTCGCTILDCWVDRSWWRVTPAGRRGHETRCR